MLNSVSRMWLVGVWFVALAVVIACSVAAGAGLSTSALVLALGVAPVGVMLLIGFGASPPTVAEILHSVNAKDDRW